MHTKTIILFVLLQAHTTHILANENADLDFLPALTEEVSEETTDNEFWQLSADTQVQHRQSDDDSSWNNVNRLHLKIDAPIATDIGFKAQLLFNAYTQESETFQSDKDLRLDVKEAYVSWQASNTQFFDVGRVNIKNGVAIGFNPNDYFKVGSLLDRSSEDASELRDARMGSLLLRSQKLWDNGSATLVLSPTINPSSHSWLSDQDIIGLNLHKTNDRSRLLFMFNQKISENFNPEFIYYNESGQHHLGLNISQSLNDQWIIYLEWNLAERDRLIDEALQTAREAGDISPQIAAQFPRKITQKTYQQMALGFSFTSSNNIVSHIEYHYNAAGLSPEEAQTWYDSMAQASINQDGNAINQLLAIRDLAQTRGESFNQHSVFLRSTISDAGIDDLNITGLAITDIKDHSYLTQIELEYETNNHSTWSFTLTRFEGDKNSTYGSVREDTRSKLYYKILF